MATEASNNWLHSHMNNVRDVTASGTIGERRSSRAVKMAVAAEVNIVFYFFYFAAVPACTGIS